MDAHLLGKLLRLLLGHLSQMLFIALVPHEDHYYVWVILSEHFIVPSFQVVERLNSCYVVGEENTVSSTEEYFGNRPELFLSSGVPNLQFKNQLVHFDQ